MNTLADRLDAYLSPYSARGAIAAGVWGACCAGILFEAYGLMEHIAAMAAYWRAL